MMDCGKCTIKSELSIPDHDDKRNLIVTSNKHSQEPAKSLCYKSVLFANKLKSSGHFSRENGVHDNRNSD